jgi:Arc/MetJ-type ribon-helix-helix transcriptional regulator
VKTKSVNVSLPSDLIEFASLDMRLSSYGTLSEYVRELIRRRREERVKEDVRFLENALAGAPEEEPPDLVQKVRQARRRWRKARR